MKKLAIFLLGLIFTGHLLYAQTQVPLLHSDTANIIVRYNDITLNWFLEPYKKPDILHLGSSLKPQYVQFITDKDSMKFAIEAGDKINFLIVLKGKENCYIQIDALANPFFFNSSLGTLLLVLIASLSTFFVWRHKIFSINQLLSLGWMVPVAFWIITIIAGFLHGDYNHLKLAVSELGTIGTGSEVFMSVATLLLGIFSLFFSIGFCKASKKLGISLIPAVLSFSMALSIAWAAVFPSGHELHGTLGPLPLLVMAGALCAALLWKKDKTYMPVRLYSLAGFLLMSLFLLRFNQNLQQNFEGLIQRFLWAGWSVWFIALGIGLKRKPKTHNKTFI